MTGFQKQCLSTITQVLNDKQLTNVLTFRKVSGKQEEYLIAEGMLGNMNCEIYIYVDEAGLMIGNKWFLCERAAYRNQQVLITAFSKLLAEKLPAKSF